MEHTGLRVPLAHFDCLDPEIVLVDKTVDIHLDFWLMGYLKVENLVLDLEKHLDNFYVLLDLLVLQFVDFEVPGLDLSWLMKGQWVQGDPEVVSDIKLDQWDFVLDQDELLSQDTEPGVPGLSVLIYLAHLFYV